MSYTDDCNEPYLMAADAIGAARTVAPALRRELPPLIGSRLKPTLNMLADRFERGRVLEPFCRNAIEVVLAECDLAIERGTHRRWVLEETGWGPDGPIYTPEIALVRTQEAKKVLRIRQLLQVAKDRVDRTMDLIASEAAVRDIRT
jgi:hypothetical protein